MTWSTEMLKKYATAPQLFHYDGNLSMRAVTQWCLLGALVVYLFGNALIFCALTFGSWYFLFEYSSKREKHAALNHLEKRMITQKGNVAFEEFQRYMMAKLIHMGQSILGLHGSVIKYSLTLSIDENPQEEEEEQVIHFPSATKVQQQQPKEQALVKEEEPVESICKRKTLSEIEQMLLEAEEMMQDLQAMLPSSSSSFSSPFKKNVRFYDDVTVYEVTRPNTEEKTHLYYSEVELDSFCEDYLASMAA